MGCTALHVLHCMYCIGLELIGLDFFGLHFSGLDGIELHCNRLRIICVALRYFYGVVHFVGLHAGALDWNGVLLRESIYIYIFLQ